MTLDAAEVFLGVYMIVLCLNAAFWLVYHCRKMYQDLYTTERASVARRKNAPPLDFTYKAMTWLTTIGAFGFSAAVIFGTAAHTFVVGRKSCLFTIGAVIVCWQLGKAGMFLSYTLRLEQVYGQSAFGYSRRALQVVACVVVIYLAALTALIIPGQAMADFVDIDRDGLFPYQCTSVVEPPLSFVIGPGILLGDLVMTIGSIVAFVMPIKRLQKSMQQQEAPSARRAKTFDQMLFVGRKYRNLVLTASISSLLFILVAIMQLGQLYMSVLANADYTINMFCLFFMSAYYPDTVFYRRFCCLCIRCCDCGKEKYVHSSTESKKEQEQEPTANSGQTATLSATSDSNPTISARKIKSVDTMDAVKTVAEQHEPIPSMTTLSSLHSETEIDLEASNTNK
eukprot:CAMPEP_0202695034 /NCGR_PEP_ID=MMETSP1385-20130828/8736_1 /ASSEMBLY_ACC=CAM_ASM_000861 /TAXON_ID=933848 /ORGANISM="Elphidium margaritaceum" /LENGTH=395 /DNA_ID=CAMNT_0049350993 /DNA_START=46 /DNA_END=1233 /DNA_ORIENTATION=+